MHGGGPTGMVSGVPDVATCRVFIYYRDSRYTGLDSRDDKKSEIDEA
jgi:hypothetical protein